MQHKPMIDETYDVVNNIDGNFEAVIVGGHQCFDNISTNN